MFDLINTYDVGEDLVVNASEASGSWSHLTWVVLGYSKELGYNPNFGVLHPRVEAIRKIYLPPGEMMVLLATTRTGFSYLLSR